jgi:HK97 family phage portal protein
MTIFDTLAAKFGFSRDSSRTEISNAVYSQDVLDAFGVVAGTAGQIVSPVTAMRVSAVSACVQKISGAISTLPIHAYSISSDIESRLPRDDLWYKLNEQPTEQYTAASHWEGISIAQLLRGDGYTWIRRGMNGNVRELLPLPYGSVSPTRHTDGSVRYYITLPELGISTWLDPFDILHFPGLGFNGLTSMSVLRWGAGSATGNALAMDEYSGKFFEGGAHPSIVVQAPNKMNQEQIEKLQSAIQNKFGGPKNYHKTPLVLTEGLQAHTLSISASDAQLIEARKYEVVDIARAFGVPPHMIGETSGASAVGAGYEAQGRNFVAYTLQQWLRKIEQELNRKLFPRNTGKFLRFDRDALIEGDSAAQAIYNRAALGGPGTGMGWMSVDEVRKTKGFAPVGGSSAEIYDPRDLPEAPEQEEKPDPAAIATANAMDKMSSVLVAMAGKETPANIVNVASPNITVAAPVTNITLPEMQPNFEATMPAQAAPVVNVTNEIPAPTVQVDVVNQVNPATVEITNNVLVEPAQPAQLTLTLPPRRSEGTVERDRDGNIMKTVTIERDA